MVEESFTISQVHKTKCAKKVQVNGYPIKALIDTGKDICLMRADQYTGLRSPRLKTKGLKIYGIAIRTNATLGEYYPRLTVDNN